MKLVASMIVRNEAHRYLGPNLEHLLAFCDLVCVIDDGSDDDGATAEVLSSDARIKVKANVSPLFYRHEGQARQALLDWTLKAVPSHVLAIDADEFVSDGPLLREMLAEDSQRSAMLCMEEVWRVRKNGYLSRQDGGWRSYPGVFVWPVPYGNHHLRIMDRQLACGRVPSRAGRRGRRDTGLSLLHFGWANEHERERRHARYVEHDGGQFHTSAHLDSILDPLATVLQECPTPRGLKDFWPALVSRANDVRA